MFSKGVEVSRVEEPKVKVVVGDTGVEQASELEGSGTRMMLFQKVGTGAGTGTNGLAWPVPNSCKYVCNKVLS